MELIKIRLKDLKGFCESELFNQFTVKPISPLRVESYIHNPRAIGEDYVLYMLVENKELLAFRTIWADYVYDGDAAIKFGWYSGNWVAPQYRRQGLSKQLFRESYVDWEKRAMFTNYADESKQLYLESELFQPLKERQGKRFYLFPDIKEIIKNKPIPSWIKEMSPFISFLMALVSETKLLFYRNSKYHYFESGIFDDDCKQILQLHNNNSLYSRGLKELNWIIQYPWVTNKTIENVEYPFSYGGIDCKIKVVKCIEQGRTSGFFIYSLVNKKMKIINYYCMHIDNLDYMAKIMIDIAIKNKISFLTVLDSELLEVLKKQSIWFVFAKKFSSNIYSTFPIKDTSKKKIFDGDGDNCFT